MAKTKTTEWPLRLCARSEDDQPTDRPLMCFKVTDRGGFLRPAHRLIPTSVGRLLHELQQQRSEMVRDDLKRSEGLVVV